MTIAVTHKYEPAFIEKLLHGESKLLDKTSVFISMND
jgi:hypothetical protein